MRNSRWLVATYIVIILIGTLVALPNILSPSMLARMPSWLPHTQVSLGLDLRGGSHLVLEVDRADLINERLQSLLQDSRRVLRDKRIETSAIRRNGDNITVTLRDPAARDNAVTELRTLSNPVSLATAIGQSDLNVATPRDNTITLNYTDAGINQYITNAVEQSLEIIRQRVDQVGVAEPTIQRVGSDRVLVQLPGEQDPSRLRQLLGSTAKMSFHLLGQQGEPGVTMIPDEQGQQYPVLDRVELSGDHLTDARAAFEQQSQRPIVSFRFDSSGAARFAQITQANVGKPFAIVLDNKVLSAPVIQTPIT
ncbi:protein translocase subunit SecDF, partial [Rhizobiales bacterium RZME27]|nr:protein translocase subunit SecDF [Endobacterium cereale]